MKPLARILVGAAAIAAAGIGGFLVHRLGADRPALQPAPSGTTPPAVSAPAAGAPAARAIPDRLPEVVLKDREGVERRLSEWSGRPLLVNFWATWCAPCRREIPLLQDLRRERTAQNVEVIGIAVDFREDVLKYAAEIGLDYPLLIGEEDGLKAIDAFGMDMLFPFTVFSDGEGRIVTVKVGELHRDEADFILDRIGELDAGRIELTAAQEAIAARLRELAAARAATETPAGPPATLPLDEDEH